MIIHYYHDTIELDKTFVIEFENVVIVSPDPGSGNVFLDSIETRPAITDQY